MQRRTFMLITAFVGNLSVSGFSAADNTTVIQEIKSYNKKLSNHSIDIVETGVHTGRYSDVALDIANNIIPRFSTPLSHILDLLEIYSLIQNPQDRDRIRPIISDTVRLYSDQLEFRVSISISELNSYISKIDNQGLISEILRLRDTLREFKKPSIDWT